MYTSGSGLRIGCLFSSLRFNPSHDCLQAFWTFRPAAPWANTLLSWTDHDFVYLLVNGFVNLVLELPDLLLTLTFDFVFQIDYFRTTYYKNGCWASQHSQLKANWVDLRSATQSLPPRLKQCKRRPKFSATASASKAETRSQQQQGEEVRREHSSQEFSVFEPLWATSRECVASLSCSQLCGQKLRRQRRYLMTESERPCACAPLTQFVPLP